MIYMYVASYGLSFSHSFPKHLKLKKQFRSEEIKLQNHKHCESTFKLPANLISNRSTYSDTNFTYNGHFWEFDWRLPTNSCSARLVDGKIAPIFSRREATRQNSLEPPQIWVFDFTQLHKRPKLEYWFTESYDNFTAFCGYFGANVFQITRMSFK